MKVRRPAFAGTFYPGDEKELVRLIEGCFTHRLGPGKLPEAEPGSGEDLVALISPHAGYVYSGPVAAHGYLHLSRRKRPETVIVVGPNHTGVGTDVSLYPEGKWATPLGQIDVDIALVRSLARRADIFSVDDFSHANEHSIEVQLPFLQYVLKNFRLVPICMLEQGKEASKKAGEALGEEMAGRNAILVASSDLTHYESADSAKRKDELVLSKALSLDVDGLYSALASSDSTACGYGPIAVAITAAKRLGAKRGRLLKYASSGDVTGDRRSVVGYSSAVFERE
ncbi:MAG: AmmeMemoRadiSam system protein B [Candidatus Brockarchaeota archaeon]|nr:AmmeMemoRadiSam system protein B [Candidatus Brockarchaeota archaeon]